MKINTAKKKRRRWKWPECGNEHRQTRPSCNPIPLLYQDCTIKSKNVNINIRMNFEAWIKKRRRRRRKREMERTCERDSARSGGEIWNEIATVSSPLSFLFFSLSVWIWESEVKRQVWGIKTTSSSVYYYCCCLQLWVFGDSLFYFL